jgi:hypothetical protein
MIAAWRLRPLFSVFLAVGVSCLAVDTPVNPEVTVGKEGQGPKKANQPAKPRVPITISKETTYIIEPLRPDGYVDYMAALNQHASRGVTPENNAVVPFIKALGPKDINEKLSKKYFQLLGIPPLPPKGDYFLDIIYFAKFDMPPSDPAKLQKYRDAETQLIDHDFDDSQRRPWKESQYPIIAQWIRANEKPLALLIEGTKRPRCYDPRIGEESESLLIAAIPNVIGYRGLARALTARAMLRLGSGKVDDAWADLLACHRFARLLSQGPCLIDTLLAIAVDGMACDADQALLQHPGLTAEMSRKIYQGLDSLPQMHKTADCLDIGERFIYLDSVQEFCRESPSSLKKSLGIYLQNTVIDKMLSDMAQSSIDWDLILRMGNSMYDRSIEASRKATRFERMAACAAIEKEFYESAKRAKDQKRMVLNVLLGNKRKILSEQIGTILNAILFPAMSASINAVDKGAMQPEVTKLDFALAAYRADHGKYPKKLAELHPQYAPEIPKDIFTGGELIYRPSEKGFLLYSVGQNGKDDGGRGFYDRSNEGEIEDYDDLAVRVPAISAEKKK